MMRRATSSTPEVVATMFHILRERQWPPGRGLQPARCHAWSQDPIDQGRRQIAADAYSRQSAGAASAHGRWRPTRRDDQFSSRLRMRRRWFGRRIRSFTLVELLIVVMIMAIAAAIMMPALGTTEATKLIAAGRLVASDVEFAQYESIVHPDDPRLIKIDSGGNQYWIAKASDVATAIDSPAGPSTMLVTFGAGRALELAGVTVQAYDFDGDDELRFDAFGQPDQTTTATITLSAGGATLTISIAPVSGEVTVQ